MEKQWEAQVDILLTINDMSLTECPLAWSKSGSNNYIIKNALQALLCWHLQYLKKAAKDK